MQRPYEGSYYWGPKRPREGHVTKVILPAKLLARLHNYLLSWHPTHKGQVRRPGLLVEVLGRLPPQGSSDLPRARQEDSIEVLATWYVNLVAVPELCPCL